MRKTIYILVGIPCAGKSSWLKAIFKKNSIGSEVVSRDDLRLHVYGKGYIPNKEREERITNLYNIQLELCIKDPLVTTIYLDNTHCKEKYINEILNKFKDRHDIKIKFFEVPLWYANIRNVIRRIKSGKWIPFSVMSSMFKNYNKLNKEKYVQYLVRE